MMRVLGISLLFSFLLATSAAFAGPRSGASFGGLRGFRSASRPSAGYFPRSYPSGRRYGGGSGFIFMPSFGWGGGWGYGGGMSSLLLTGMVLFGAVLVVRSIRRAARRGALTYGAPHDDDEIAQYSGRAYVYKIQLGIGRSGRGIQKRLEQFASTGDTASEAGLAQLLRQTALELMREKDSIRYGQVDPGGPYSMTNAEAKLTGTAMAERARFQVERVRGTDGQVRRSEAAASVGLEALEYLVVTVLVATRSPLSGLQKLEHRQGLGTLLTTLGGVPASTLLGLEVVWTPADPEDSLTEMDVMTTYPEMRSL
jgi:uncharacterized membrane protein